MSTKKAGRPDPRVRLSAGWTAPRKAKIEWSCPLSVQLPDQSNADRPRGPVSMGVFSCMADIPDVIARKTALFVQFQRIRGVIKVS